MTSTTDKRKAFRALHAEGCFVIPNPWDAGSARMLQHLGFKALASTSAGFAWTAGQPDYRVSRAAALAHLALLSAAVDLPVNADFEAGFAATPEGVGESGKGGGVSGVEPEGDGLAPERAYTAGRFVDRWIGVQEGEISALACETQRDSAPDAARGAGDEGGLTGEGHQCLRASRMSSRTAAGGSGMTVAPSDSRCSRRHRSRGLRRS